MDQPSSKKFIPLVATTELSRDCLIPVEADGHKFLVIREKGNSYVIKNACGHFGTSLVNSEVKDGTICCPHHLIKFDLLTGKIVNRPWENCDPIETYESGFSDGFIGVYL